MKYKSIIPDDDWLHKKKSKATKESESKPKKKSLMKKLKDFVKEATKEADGTQS
jgi:hypothetical protein